MNSRIRSPSDEGTFQVNFGQVTKVTETDIPAYTGAYSVTPSDEAQTLSTSGKYMKDDVNVARIPYYETTNNTGGMTVYIGKEV